MDCYPKLTAMESLELALLGYSFKMVLMEAKASPPISLISMNSTSLLFSTS